MNYKDAIKKIEEFKYMIGKKVEQREITNLVLVPSNRQSDTEIINKIYWGKDTSDILQEHKDFAIIVVYDLPSFAQTGVIFKEDLKDVIKRLAE